MPQTRTPTLIIVTGLPGTGKTTLSRIIASELKLPLLAKDAIKEIMFDKLGWSDREWSAKLAHATFGIMDYVIEEQLKAGNTIIVEANFKPQLASPKFQAWQQQYACRIVQVVCRAELEVLANRLHARNQTDRHPGHLDRDSIATNRQALTHRLEDGEDQPLAVDGSVIIADTTDLDAFKPKRIVASLRHHLS